MLNETVQWRTLSSLFSQETPKINNMTGRTRTLLKIFQIFTCKYFLGLKFVVLGLVFGVASALYVGDGSTWCDEGAVGESYPNTFDITEYYFCRSPGTAILTKCAPGTGFVRNNNVMACVDWREWNCTYKGDSLGNNCCTSPNLRCSDINPTIYWQCQENGEGQQFSVARQCPEGTGYVDYNGVASCVFWDQWLNICQKNQGSL